MLDQQVASDKTCVPTSEASNEMMKTVGNCALSVKSGHNKDLSRWLATVMTTKPSTLIEMNTSTINVTEVKDLTR